MIAHPPFVGAAGFEPATPCSQSRYANRTALHPDDRQTVSGLNRVANIRDWANIANEYGVLPADKR